MSVALFIAACVSLACAALPAGLFLRNLGLYRTPPEPAGPVEGAVSILIPARNEERNIGRAVEAAAASRGVDVEVVVLDDHSSDRTAEIVRALAARDPRIRLESAPPLPDGWCGKQFACWTLAHRATHDRLLFQDADVTLGPDAAARLAHFQAVSGADLVSGIPRQETRSFLERLLIPLIHFILLGFLPLDQMRRSRLPAYGAACGQLILVRREAYEAVGGHERIARTLHDGLELPRLFRRGGRSTDLCDVTSLARCRMYETSVATWRGLQKNATAGLAAPAMIVPATLLLLFGQVLPVVWLGLSLRGDCVWTQLVAGLATALAWLPRVAGAVRFRQSVLGVVLHPLGIVIFLAIQWTALIAERLGYRAVWKGRDYQPAA